MIMILTGKAREDFGDQCRYNYYEFTQLDLVYQYALIIEWLDSVGIYIELNRFTHGLRFKFWHYTISDFKGVHLNSNLENTINTDSRQEATKQAIIKANEMYNGKYNYQ